MAIPKATRRDPPPPESAGEDQNLTAIVAANLRRLRLRRGLSLERLAQRSGVSRAMLGQIELGQSTPTINVVWKIARALGVTFSALISAKDGGAVHVMPAAQGKRLTSADGAFTSRALFPANEPRRVELYELTLAAGGVEIAEPHAPGTTENLVVHRGHVEIEVDGQRHALGPGDAIFFHADRPHAYRGGADGLAIMYLLMTYADEIE